MDLSDEGLYTVLADNGRGLPADARVTLAVDDTLEKQIPGKVTKFNSWGNLVPNESLFIS